MTLDQPRLAHLSNGQLFLAEEEESLKDYLGVIRYAYGSLRGIRVFMVEAMTTLTPNPTGGSFRQPLSEHLREIDLRSVPICESNWKEKLLCVQ